MNQLHLRAETGSSPDLCKKLKGLYTFAYRRLVDANLHHRIESLDEALNVLKFQRETWAMLMEQLSKNKAASPPHRIDIPGPDARMEASISMQG